MTIAWSRSALYFLSAVLFPLKRCHAAFALSFCFVHNISWSWWFMFWCKTWVANVIERGMTSWFEKNVWDDCFWNEGTCVLRHDALNIFQKHWHEPVRKRTMVCLWAVTLYLTEKRGQFRDPASDKHSLHWNLIQTRHCPVRLRTVSQNSSLKGCFSKFLSCLM